jgi:hypothetical protein
MEARVRAVRGSDVAWMRSSSEMIVGVEDGSSEISGDADVGDSLSREEVVGGVEVGKLAVGIDLGGM